jgi:ceramide glucosyltransferase
VILALVFLALLLLSVAGYTVAVLALERTRGASRRAGLPGDLTAPVSIVKPLSGLDDELEKNLESFFALDYPDYEVIFSFARRNDPAFAVARRVADRHPAVASVFVVDGREPGGNAKVNRLVAGLRYARCGHLLMADGNVRVHHDFLRRAMAQMAGPRVGLVSHLFVARGARTLGSRLESLHLNGALRAGTAAVAGVLKMPCVVGKSILVSRRALIAIGGLETLRDHLAEDYLLGQAISGAGYGVVLSGDEITTTEISRGLTEVWKRQRRWAILRKRLGRLSYGSELLASPLPWFCGAVAASPGHPGLAAIALAVYAARIALEGFSARRAGVPFTALDGALCPLRDLAVAALFWAGLFGRRTAWRGRSLRVGKRTLIGRFEQNPSVSPSFGKVAEQN